MNMPLRTPAHHSKRLSSLLAAPAVLLLSQGQAQAILTYNIFESAGNVVVQTNGSLNLTGVTPIGTFICGGVGSYNGVLYSDLAYVCTGPANPVSTIGIMGPSSFNGSVFILPASSVSGLSTMLVGGDEVPYFGIDSSYISSTSINSSATFNGTTLAGLGFTTTGLIGTWTLSNGETINVVIGDPSPPSAATPGPLPLLGAGAAFGWSRRLRKRITTPLITPPQA
jgi:MYXO-CTERM domain-containing protein